jgi:Domain of unknown function (DUF5666)
VKLSNFKCAPFLLVLAIVAGMWACASGGGISGTALVIGPIAGFGSIVVNDDELDTTDAMVSIEGDPATISDLRLGMFVYVRGQVDIHGRSGVAERISADHLIQGPIDGVNAADGTFSALDQLVITSGETVFDQTTLQTLAAGDVVEIFGFLDADASVRATRVEKTPNATEFEVTGTISALDTTAQTFKLGVLTVDFHSALIENAPPGGLDNGLLVEVETDAPPIGDAITASGVEVRTLDVIFEVGDGADIQGFVTTVVSASEIVLNASQRVLVTDSTRFERGTRADLVVNARVEIDGVLDTDGAVTANEIEYVALAGP